MHYYTASYKRSIYCKYLFMCLVSRLLNIFANSYLYCMWRINMIVGLYTGASSMVSQGDYQAVIARNLANINTAGYKKNVAVFQSFISSTSNQDQTNTTTGTGSSLGTIATDFSQGMLEYTGND